MKMKRILAIAACLLTGAALFGCGTERAAQDAPAATPTPGPGQAALSQKEIRAEVRRYLHADKDLFAEEELAAITFLDLSGKEVTDLSDLALLPNLTELTLRNTAVEDYGVLAACGSLQSLTMENGGRNVLAALPCMPALTALSLSADMPVTDLSALAGLPNLETLTLTVDGEAGVTAPAALGKLRRLTELNLTVSGGGAENGAFLNAAAGLAGLTRLSLTLPESGTDRDYGRLAGLESLRGLSLCVSGYREMASLPKLPALLDLTIRGNGRAPAGFPDMERFPSLMHLTLENTAIRSFEDFLPLTKLTSLTLLQNNSLEEGAFQSLALLPGLARVTYGGRAEQETVAMLMALLPEAYVSVARK